MSTLLPPKTSFTDPSVTEGQFKVAFEAMHDYMTENLGGVGGRVQNHGSVSLDYISSTSIRLNPRDGNRVNVKTGSIWQGRTIPAAGIIANNTNTFLEGAGGSTLAADTRYFVYLFDNSGALTIDFSETSSAADTDTGVQIRTGQPSRTLVGEVTTDSSGQFSEGNTLSYFGGSGRPGVYEFVEEVTINNDALVEFGHSGTDLLVGFLDGWRYKFELEEYTNASIGDWILLSQLYDQGTTSYLASGDPYVNAGQRTIGAIQSPYRTNDDFIYAFGSVAAATAAEAVGTLAYTAASGEIEYMHLAGPRTTRWHVPWAGGGEANPAAEWSIQSAGGLVHDAVYNFTAIKFYAQSGNMGSGKIRMYRMKET